MLPRNPPPCTAHPYRRHIECPFLSACYFGMAYFSWTRKLPARPPVCVQRNSPWFGRLAPVAEGGGSGDLELGGAGTPRIMLDGLREQTSPSLGAAGPGGERDPRRRGGGARRNGGGEHAESDGSQSVAVDGESAPLLDADLRSV